MRNGHAVSEFDEKTRVTQVVQKPAGEENVGNDCLVVIYAPEPGLLGKRFVLDRAVLRVGRGTDNTVVLDGDSVSRRHARFEKRGTRWYVADYTYGSLFKVQRGVVTIDPIRGKNFNLKAGKQFFIFYKRGK